MFSSRDLHHAPYTHKSGSFDPALGHLSLLFGTRMRKKGFQDTTCPLNLSSMGFYFKATALLTLSRGAIVFNASSFIS